MTSLSCSHMYFPFAPQISNRFHFSRFVFRTGEEKSWIWQALSLEPTLTQAVLLVQMILEASNTSSPRETFVPKISIIPQGSSFCRRLWLFLRLSLILSFKRHFEGLEHCRSPPSLFTQMFLVLRMYTCEAGSLGRNA